MKGFMSFTVLCLCFFVSFVIAKPSPELLDGWSTEFSSFRNLTEIIMTDINGDGKDELIVGQNNEVHVLDETGNDVANWPQYANSDWLKQVEIVAAGDLDGDGDDEVLAMDERVVYAWDFATATAIPGWPVTVGGGNYDIALGDFDGNPNDHEVAVVTSSRLTVLDGDGTAMIGWPVSVSSYPRYLSVGDLDRDGVDELVVSLHKSGYASSTVSVYSALGELVSGWPKSGNGPFSTAAVLCDMDADDDLEIVAHTINGDQTGKIFAWNMDATPVSGWPVNRNAFDISAGDLDADDEPELIITYSNSSYYADHMAVLNVNGQVLSSREIELRSSATIVNADNDPESEIIFPSHYGKLYVMDGDTGDLSGYPFYAASSISARQPAVGDIDGDGDIEIFVQQYDDCRISAYDLDVPVGWYDWPIVRRDVHRSSCWSPPQTAAFDALEIDGPFEIRANTTTAYSCWAYFDDGTNYDVSEYAYWWVDSGNAYVNSNGLVMTGNIDVAEEIVINCWYIENGFDELASYSVLVRPEVQVLYVDDDAVCDPNVYSSVESDPDENGTLEHPFDSIQEAIDVVGSGYNDRVVVLPGTYNENVDCLGKDFILTSTNPNDPAIVESTIIQFESVYGSSIILADGELLGFNIFGHITIGDSVLWIAYSPTISHCSITSQGNCIEFYVPYEQGPTNFIVENNVMKLVGDRNYGSCVYVSTQSNANGGANGVIRNNTMIGSANANAVSYGMRLSKPYVLNNIIVGFGNGINIARDALVSERLARIKYNDFYGNNVNCLVDSESTAIVGINSNISVSPSFANSNVGDYRLRPYSGCIDMGDPYSLPGSGVFDFYGQSRLYNNRVDIGASEYNGVGQTAGDFDNDEDVDMADLQTISYQWMAPTCSGCYVSDLNGDGDVNLEDIVMLAGNWLK